MKRTWYFAVMIFCVILLACQPVGNPGGGGGGVVNGDAETNGDNGDTGDTGDAGDAGNPVDVGGGGGEAGGGSVSDRCGDSSQLAGEIFMYNWTEYIDPDIIDQFEEECGVRVVETNYDSNETLLASLQAGGGGYDIIVPSDYMVQIMIDEGMLMEIDFNVVTNIANMDPLNVNQYFDPDQKYTVPYFWGTSGFAVDTNAVAEVEESWEMVFDTESPYCGEISMLDDQRETLGAALMYSGETVIAHIWTGDAILAGDPEYGGRDGIVYVIPEEGCTIWQDNLAVPVDSANAYTAMVFINYLQYPEIAAQNAEWVGYATPNEAAKEFIDPEILADESVYPTAEVSARLQWIEDVGDALQLYDRIWTEFKAAIGSGG